VLFKVINFSANGKPACDFLCVSDINLPFTLCYLRAVVDYWSDFTVNRKYLILNAVIGGDLIQLGKFASKLEISLCHMI